MKEKMFLHFLKGKLGALSLYVSPSFSAFFH